MTLLRNAQSEDLVNIEDHAVVSWPEGEDKPTIEHGHDDTKRGAGWGSFWGLLLGALFAVPVLGVVAGGALGAMSKASEKLGISKDKLEAIRDEITPGTSALFVVTNAGDLDRLGERFHGLNMKLVETNLTPAEKKDLLETFGS
ncbi:DUF1269 domain-containing protein [Xylanimonas sp. McL0601]|uniref:DUF1269 domain-containing protein n=1 Tax=Xylanimonas sp. McL0601 TaxID=3414739 RepID=UPI003CF15126